MAGGYSGMTATDDTAALPRLTRAQYVYTL